MFVPEPSSQLQKLARYEIACFDFIYLCFIYLFTIALQHHAETVHYDYKIIITMVLRVRWQHVSPNSYQFLFLL